MATEGDRSLSSGISIPQWMKSKIETRTIFDDGAFSPPASDDTFLYIRYPRIVSTESTNKLTTATDLQNRTSVANRATETIQNAIDFSNHTAPCREYIQNSGYQPNIKHVKSSPDVKVKSNGIDDGFKGEAAKCGSSIIKVAHQMVSGKLPHSSTLPEECAVAPPDFDPSRRRGSKSLPSSPLSSPKSKRKITNKYFTGAFINREETHNSWILSGLLGNRDISRSISHIVEEDTKEDLARAISEINLEEKRPVEQKPNKNVYKAKPSELREMNFWSPTSM